MQSTFLSTEVVSGVLVAKLRCEKVAERESAVIAGELTPLLQGHAWKVVLDLQEVMLLASVGLGALVTLNMNCKANGGKMAVCGVGNDLMDVLRITRLEKVLSIVKDRDSAIKAVG